MSLSIVAKTFSHNISYNTFCFNTLWKILAELIPEYYKRIYVFSKLKYSTIQYSFDFIFSTDYIYYIYANLN